MADTDPRHTDKIPHNSNRRFKNGFTGKPYRRTPFPAIIDPPSAAEENSPPFSRCNPARLCLFSPMSGSLRPAWLAAGTVLYLFLNAANAQNPLEWLLRDREREREYSPFDRDEGSSRPTRHYGVRATERGSGTLGIKGPNRRLQQAPVSLRRDGSAQFLLRGERDYLLSGTWRRGPGHEALITIDTAYDRSPAKGTGTVTLTGNSFSRIDLRGESVAFDGKFNARFQAGSAEKPQPPRFSLDSARRGSGSMGISGPNRRLRQAHVRLQADGDARLTFQGDNDDFEFVGAWARGQQDTIDLHITRGPDRRPMRATGSLNLHRDEGFSQIEILGNSPSLGGRVRVSFKVEESETGRGDRRDRGTLWELEGRGVIGKPGPNLDLKSARVTLYQNGRASLQFEGERRHLLEATWYRSREPDAVELRLDRINRRPASGTGRVRFDGDRLRGVECRGNAHDYRGDFRISFQGDQAPASPYQRSGANGNRRQR